MPRESVLLGGGVKKKKEVIPTEEAPVPKLVEPALKEEVVIDTPKEVESKPAQPEVRQESHPGEMNREQEIDYLNKNIEFIKLSEIAKTMRDNLANGIGLLPDDNFLSHIKKRYLKLQNEISAVDWDLPTGSEYKDAHDLNWFINRLKAMGVEPKIKDIVFKTKGRVAKTETSQVAQPDVQEEVIPEAVTGEVAPTVEPAAEGGSDTSVAKEDSTEPNQPKEVEVLDSFNEKKFGKEIASAKNFEELFAVLNKYETIPGARGEFYNTLDLGKMINFIREQVGSSKYSAESYRTWIPRTGGLRDKVFALLDKEVMAAKPISIEPEPVAPPIPKVEIPKPTGETEAPEPEPESKIPPIPLTAEPAGPTFNVHNVTVEDSRGFWKSRDGKESVGKRFKGFVKDKYLDYKEKGKKVWGPLKERVFGVATFGWWDMHQANRFNTATKAVGNSFGLEASKIEQADGLLDFDSAMSEAKELRRRAENEIDDLGVSKEDGHQIWALYDKISGQITSEKKRSNERVIKNIEAVMAQAKADLRKRLESDSKLLRFLKLDKYLETNTGKQALTEEKFAYLEHRLRERLIFMSNHAVFEQYEDFTALTREILDEKWKRRYVYSGVEAALASIASGALPKLIGVTLAMNSLPKVK